MIIKSWVSTFICLIDGTQNFYMKSGAERKISNCIASIDQNTFCSEPMNTIQTIHMWCIELYRCREAIEITMAGLTGRWGIWQRDKGQA